MSFTHREVRVERGGGIKGVVTAAYILLIVVTIGGMALHNLIVLSHTFRRKYLYQKQNAEIVRLNRFERIWHYLLLSSFILLVLTGFALKYPDSIAYKWMYSAGLPELVRAGAHRLAAIALTACMGAILVYQVVSRSGRKWWVEMLPRVQDVRDFFASMRYHLSLTRPQPRFGVFSYVEKAEYWALMWGTLIMLITGLVLWFPKFLPESWPAWVIDVARLIHYYEAILATLAIIVWHFFHTIFRPGEYPMDTSWLSGVLTRKEAHHRFTPEAIEAQRPPKRPETTRVQAIESAEWDGDDEPPRE